MRARVCVSWDQVCVVMLWWFMNSEIVADDRMLCLVMHCQQVGCDVGAGQDGCMAVWFKVISAFMVTGQSAKCMQCQAVSMCDTLQADAVVSYVGMGPHLATAVAAHGRQPGQSIADIMVA